jgi:hypothetical protein
MTPEQLHEEVINLRADLRKEFGDFKYDLTWRLVTILGVQTVIILGAVYFLLSDLDRARHIGSSLTQFRAP